MATVASLRDEGGPTSRDKNLPPEIILDPLQTNMDCDSNSGCLTFIAVIWKNKKFGLGVMEQPHCLGRKYH